MRARDTHTSIDKRRERERQSEPRCEHERERELNGNCTMLEVCRYEYMCRRTVP